MFTDDLHSCRMGRANAYLAPSEIRFTQNSIRNTFNEPDESEDEFIGETLDELCDGDCEVGDIEPIKVFRKGGHWWSADNRRLWVFREYERLGGCDKVPVKVINRKRMNNTKFTTENDGVDVKIRGGSPRGKWHKLTDNILKTPKTTHKGIQGRREVVSTQRLHGTENLCSSKVISESHLIYHQGLDKLRLEGRHVHAGDIKTIFPSTTENNGNGVEECKYRPLLHHYNIFQSIKADTFKPRPEKDSIFRQGLDKSPLGTQRVRDIDPVKTVSTKTTERNANDIGHYRYRPSWHEDYSWQFQPDMSKFKPERGSSFYQGLDKPRLETQRVHDPDPVKAASPNTTGLSGYNFTPYKYRSILHDDHNWQIENSNHTGQTFVESFDGSTKAKERIPQYTGDVFNYHALDEKSRDIGTTYNTGRRLWWDYSSQDSDVLKLSSVRPARETQLQHKHRSFPEEVKICKRQPTSATQSDSYTSYRWRTGGYLESKPRITGPHRSTLPDIFRNCDEMQGGTSSDEDRVLIARQRKRELMRQRVLLSNPRRNYRPQERCVESVETQWYPILLPVVFFIFAVLMSFFRSIQTEKGNK